MARFRRTKLNHLEKHEAAAAPATTKCALPGCIQPTGVSFSVGSPRLQPLATAHNNASHAPFDDCWRNDSTGTSFEPEGDKNDTDKSTKEDRITFQEIIAVLMAKPESYRTNSPGAAVHQNALSRDPARVRQREKQAVAGGRNGNGKETEKG